MQTEPQDAISSAPAKPSFAERTAPIRWKNFRSSAHVVGVNISPDGTEIWSRGIGKTHYAIAGARAHVAGHGVIVFQAPTYELAVTVPKHAHKHAHTFVAGFNTWMMNGAYVPGASA